MSAATCRSVGMEVPPGSGGRKAARIVWEARQRAGLSRTELAEMAGLPSRTLRRIESAEVVPRLDTVERLLLGCGRTLSTEPRPAPAEPERGREAPNLIKALYHLRGFQVDHVLVGAIAARFRGAVVDVSGVDIAIPDEARQRGHLVRAVARLDRRFSRVPVRAIDLPETRFDQLWRTATPLGPVPTLVASIDDLIDLETDQVRRERLRRLRERRDRGA